jgi:hypothetical protein
MSFSVGKRNKVKEGVEIRIFITYVAFNNKTKYIYRSNYVEIRYDTVLKIHTYTYV